MIYRKKYPRNPKDKRSSYSGIKDLQDTQEKKIRPGWDKAAREAHENGDDKLMLNFSDDFEQDGWIW